MYCYGLGGAALQARTVDPNRKQPAYEPVFTHKATPEDLLAAWPSTHDDFNKIEHVTALNILKMAMYNYKHSLTDQYTLCRALEPYRQHYIPLTGPGQHPTLPMIWNESVLSKQGLVRDLVADVSDIPAQVMLLPIRIRLGPWTDKPAKTVLLVDMRQQDWLPKDQSLRLAYKCKATLKRHGFYDVEVEVRAVPSVSWGTHANYNLKGSSKSSGQPRHAQTPLQSSNKPAWHISRSTLHLAHRLCIIGALKLPRKRSRHASSHVYSKMLVLWASRFQLHTQNRALWV
jgi:hypothetical protein